MADYPERPDQIARRIDSSGSSSANSGGGDGLQQGNRIRIADRSANVGLTRQTVMPRLRFPMQFSVL